MVTAEVELLQEEQTLEALTRELLETLARVVTAEVELLMAQRAPLVQQECGNHMVLMEGIMFPLLITTSFTQTMGI